MAGEDFAAAKSRYSSADVALSYGVPLKMDRNGGGEGPCPICKSGDDRFVTFPVSGKWLCRDCRRAGRKCTGDAIDLVSLVEGIPLREAAMRLSGGNMLKPVTLAEPQKKPSPQVSNSWTDDAWQDSTRRYLKLCERAFAGSAAERYLRERGIDTELATSYRVGYCERYDSVVLPAWSPDGLTIRGVQHRAIDPLSKARYHLRKGSGAGVFAERAGQDDTHRPLVFVEGEINALSIQTATAGKFEALSLGSEVNTRPLSELALRFKDREHVVFWFDEPTASHTAVSAFGRGSILTSPSVRDKTLDANDFLVRYGADSLREIVEAKVPESARNRDQRASCFTIC